MSLTHLVVDGPLAVLSLVRPGDSRISFEMRRGLSVAVWSEELGQRRQQLLDEQAAEVLDGLPLLRRKARQLVEEAANLISSNAFDAVG